jgi:hypothetical protein
MASISLSVDIGDLENEELDLMEDKVTKLLNDGGLKNFEVNETDREEDSEESDD